MTFAELLELLGYTDGEHVGICWQPMHDKEFRKAVVGYGGAADTAMLIGPNADTWFQVNPTAPRPVDDDGRQKGRGTAEDVTRLAALWADLDIKAGGCNSVEQAQTIIANLSEWLGTRPSAIVLSGHGLQPYWPIEDGQLVPTGSDYASMIEASAELRANAAALLRRWGRLVQHVANMQGAKVDNVFDLPRILRVPGTTNHKADPVSVLCIPDSGAPLSMDDIDEHLDEAGIHQIDDTENNTGNNTAVSDVADWRYAAIVCGYAHTMIAGWAADSPTARHPWLLSQATRLAAAHRNGCLTEADHRAAAGKLEARFRDLCARGGDARRVPAFEVADALAEGVRKAAAKSEAQLDLELGKHLHLGQLAGGGLDPPGGFSGSPTKTADRSVNGPVSQPAKHGDTPNGVASVIEQVAGSTTAGDDEVDDDDDPIAVAVRQRALQLRIDDEARELYSDWQASALGHEMPDVVNLQDFLAVPDEDAQYRIVDLWPTGGNVLLAAQYKAGKTSMVANLLRSLADGDQFLGHFDTEPPRRITLLDDELDERMLRRWLRQQGIQNSDRIDVVSLKGRLATFNILNARSRARWAERIRGSELIILDCLRPCLDALGLDEHRDAGRFLVAWDSLKKEAGVSESIVVHHMGHGQERSRGDSRLLDWPDVNWKIVKEAQSEDADVEEIGDSGGRRFFSAHGRDVNVPEGMLEWEPLMRSLTYHEGGRREAKADKAVDVIRAILSSPENIGGLGTVELTRKLSEESIGKTIARRAIKKAIADCTLLEMHGSRNAKILTLNPSAAL